MTKRYFVEDDVMARDSLNKKYDEDDITYCHTCHYMTKTSIGGYCMKKDCVAPKAD